MRFSVLPLVVLFIILAAFVFVSPVSAQDEVPPEPEVPPAEVAPLEETEPIAGNEDSGELAADETSGGLPQSASGTDEPANAGDPWFKVGTITYHFLTDCSAHPGDPTCFESPTPILRALVAIIDGLIPTDGMIYVEGGPDYNESIVIDGIPGIKGIIGSVDPMTNQPDATLNGRLWIRNQPAGFTLHGLNIFGNEVAPDDDHDLKPDYPLGPLGFENMIGPVVVSNVMARNSNPGGVGISVRLHQSDITMTDVDSSGNAGGGLNITITEEGKKVTIINGSFDRNSGNDFANGIYIENKGPVLLDGISASMNDGIKPALWLASTGSLTIRNGVFSQNSNANGISNSFSVPTGSVTLKNVDASSNGISGIGLSIKGTLLVQGIQANENSSKGAYFVTKSPESAIWVNTTSGNIYISSGHFDRNGNIGLDILAKGYITLGDVSANGNHGILGASLVTKKSQSISDGDFSNNDFDGIWVDLDGVLSLCKVRADNNGSHGFTMYYGASSLVIKGSAPGDNSFSNNGKTGLYDLDFYTAQMNYVVVNGNGENGIEFTTRMSLSMNHVEANNNGEYGVIIKQMPPGKFVNVSVKTSDFSDNGFSGLKIDTTGVISLVDVSANNNNQGGLILDNATIVGSQPVILTRVVANGNGNHGIGITTVGQVKTLNITACNNGEEGMFVDMYYLSKPYGFTLKGGYFAENNGDGIQIGNAGPVAVMGAISELNTGDGFQIYSGSDVKITDSDSLRNWGSGTRVDNEGSIFITHTRSDENGAYGAWLNNKAGILGKKIAITNSTFNGNSNDGVMADSVGAVSLTNVEASDNSLKGGTISIGDTVVDVTSIYYSDFWWFTATADSHLTISLEKYQSLGWDPYVSVFDSGNSLICFDDDGGVGTDSLIVDCHIPADGDYYIHVSPFNTVGGKYKLVLTTMGGAPSGHEINQPGYGVRLFSLRDLSAPLVIKNTAGNELAFDLNSADGVYILTNGSVTLSNIYARDNGFYGASITNDAAVRLVRLNSGEFNYNSSGGVFIQSSGSISINRVNASFNNGTGVELTNVSSPSTFQPISIINDARKIGMEGNGFQNNVITGLIINATGKVTLNNVEAAGNGVNGAQVLNNILGSADVIISNSYFDDNLVSGFGLHINSLGAITLNKGSSSGNFLEGAFIDNFGAQLVIKKAITIRNFVFDNNGSDGLNVLSNGAIGISNLSASGNGGNGASLQNETGTGFVNLLVTTGTINQFSNNGGYGLYISSNGATALSRVYALDNADYGVTINNQGSLTGGGVTISGGEMSGSGNMNNGLIIITSGTVTLGSVTASNNEGWGASISVQALVSNTKATAISRSIFNNNAGYGLNIQSNGAITLNGVSAKGNGSEGAYLDNQAAGSLIKPAVIVLSSLAASDLTGNAGGLFIISKGAVSLTGVVANDGLDQEGIHIDNCVLDLGACTASGNVTLTSITARNNMLGGVKIATNGALVKLTGVIAMVNGMDDDPEPEGYSGIVIESHNEAGLVTINNSVSMGNAKHGIYIAKSAVAPMPVITGIVYFGNNVLGGEANSNLLIANLY